MSDINELNVGVRWYVVHTYSGYENKVMASIQKVVENRGLGNLIFDTRVPTEKVIEKKVVKKKKTAKRGDDDVEVEESEIEEKEVEYKLFPSYVYIKMIMTELSWHVVRNISGVTGFVGPGSRPTPLSDEEVEALNIEEKKVRLTFDVGDEVTIIGGSDGVVGLKGIVVAISDNMKKVTVNVASGSGRRAIPVDLDVEFVKPV